MMIDKKQLEEALFKYLANIGKSSFPYENLIHGIYYYLTVNNNEFFSTYQYQIDHSNRKIKNKTLADLLNNGPIDAIMLQEILWSFINSGIIIKEFNTWTISDPKEDRFHVTQWGLKIINDVKPTPYDYEEFLKDISNLINDETSFYLIQSLECFNKNLFVPSAIMLGVAAENIILEISDIAELKLVKKEKYKKILKDKGHQITGHEEALSEIIKSKKKEMPNDLKKDIEKEFISFFDLIRLTRNEAGHPSKVKMDRDGAYINYLTFRRFCIKANKLKKWLEKQEAI